MFRILQGDLVMKLDRSAQWKTLISNRSVCGHPSSRSVPCEFGSVLIYRLMVLSSIRHLITGNLGQALYSIFGSFSYSNSSAGLLLSIYSNSQPPATPWDISKEKPNLCYFRHSCLYRLSIHHSIFVITFSFLVNNIRTVRQWASPAIAQILAEKNLRWNSRGVLQRRFEMLKLMEQLRYRSSSFQQLLMWELFSFSVQPS